MLKYLNIQNLLDHLYLAADSALWINRLSIVEDIFRPLFTISRYIFSYCTL